jgi:cysteine desulfurase/selenocysteine lyase
VPFLPGGGSSVRLADGALQDLTMPGGLEGGTPDVAGIAGLAAAIEFIEEIGLDRIAAHGRALTRFLVDRLREIPGVTLLPGVAWGRTRSGTGSWPSASTAHAPMTSASRLAPAAYTSRRSKRSTRFFSRSSRHGIRPLVSAEWR